MDQQQHDVWTKPIRPYFSGVIAFASRILSVGTGFLFVLMMTRNLTAEEFGVLNNVNDVTGLLIVFVGVFPFWITRYVARGFESSSLTGVVLNMAIGMLVLVVGLTLTPALTAVFKVTQLYYVLGSLNAFEMYILSGLEAVAGARRPHLIGYSLIIGEALKLAIAYVLVMIFRFSLLGFVWSLIGCSLSSIAFYLFKVKDQLRGRISANYVRAWIKGSFLNIYYAAGMRLASLEVIVLILLSGDVARAYYATGIMLTSLVHHATALAVSLYPRLLVGESEKAFESSLKQVFMFAVPMSFGIVAMAEAFLTILNPSYLVIVRLVYLMSIGALLNNFSHLLNVILSATERVDAEGSFTGKQIASSALFKLATIPYAYAALDLPILFLLLSHFASTPLEAASLCFLLKFALDCAIVFVKYVIVRRGVDIKIPHWALLKYSFASMVMAIILRSLQLPPRILTVLVQVGFGAITYFAVLYLLDKELRQTMRILSGKMFDATIRKSKSGLAHGALRQTSGTRLRAEGDCI